MMENLTIHKMARDAGFFILPEGGAWVTIKGCPAWPKGQRLIKAHRDAGMQHMDIYWAFKEVFTLGDFTVNRYRRRHLCLPEAVHYDTSQGKTWGEAYDRALEELRGRVEDAPYQTSYQHSLVTLSFPHPEEVRLYNGEVAVMDRETIRMLLAEDYLDVIPFGRTQIPALEGVVSELADALMLDGLSESEAYQELMTVDPSTTPFIPQWFYRPKGWYRNMFCEEVA